MIPADVATKAALANLEAALGGEITGLRSELKSEIGGFRAETKHDMSSLKQDVSSLRKDIDGSLREPELRMTVKLGAIIAAAVAVVAALQKFF